MKKMVLGGILALILALTGCEKQEGENLSPAPQDEPAEKEEQPAADIASGLDSFEFAVGDRVCRLPASFGEMAEQGWAYGEDTTAKVEAESFLEEQEFSLGDYVCRAQVMNFSAEAQPVQQCFITAVMLRQDEKNQIALPGNLILGEATKVQALEQYGKPRDQYEDGDRILFTYEYGIQKKAMLTFQADTEILLEAELYNQTNPAERELYENASREKTPEVEQYQAPAALSDDLMDFTVEYADSLYRLPAPVSAFTDNGWEIDWESSDEAVKSGKYGYVTLQRGTQSLYTVVCNYGEDVTAVNNCFVTGVHGDLAATKVPIRVAGGITLGMPKQDFLAAVEGMKWEESSGTQENSLSYLFYQEGSRDNYTEVILDQDLEMIREIKVVHFREEKGEER